MITLIKGAKRNVGMGVSRLKNEDFTISGVTCEVFNVSHALIEEGLGIIDGHNVYYYLDTSQDHFEIKKNYRVYFSVEIAGTLKVLKDFIEVRIER